MDPVLAFVLGMLVSALVVGGVAVLVVRRTLLREPEPAAEERALHVLGSTVAEQAVVAPALTVAERLTQVDEMRAQDLIDPEEHARARTEILAEHDAATGDPAADPER